MGMDSGDLSDFVENVEWECRGMPATKNVIMYGCCSDPYPDITYTVLLQRRSSFYIFNLLLPCFLISFLAPLGFYLPADSGEKVSLGVTVLLALTVFQLMVAESMPPSESVPLIGKKVLFFFRNIFNNLFLLHGLCFCHSIIKKIYTRNRTGMHGPKMTYDLVMHWYVFSFQIKGTLRNFTVKTWAIFIYVAM